MASLEYWYIDDMARFRRERETLAALAAEAEWLTVGTLRFDDDMRLVVDCDLDIGHRQYPVQLRYPRTFPHSPPSVFPRGDTTRWTGHQFGAGGELCLEYRSDNWSPEFLGRALVESAHRLLSGESPASGVSVEVPSVHRHTEGQRLRTAYRRLLVSRETLARWDGLAVGAHLTGETIPQVSPDQVVYFVSQLVSGDDAWPDPVLPKVISENLTPIPTFITRVPDTWAELNPAVKADFQEGARSLGWVQDTGLLIVLRGNNAVFAYRVFDTSVEQLWFVLPEPAADRVDPAFAVLAGRSVGIVGCGSLGSKMATMLARAGVDKFFLTDDDILLPDNLVRHDLDWQEVGLHKATGLSHRLRRIRASISVRKRSQRLGGQDSSESAENLLTALGGCDLIIDATANPSATNIVAGIAAMHQVPVIWAEVFTGGIGGLIARWRPGIEPSIPRMRWAVDNWFDERGIPPLRAPAPYESGGEAPPFIADDADVTAIAAPAARMAIDLLLGRSPSHFPSSAYLIGLAPSPAFAQPFETFPLDFPPQEDGEAPSELSPEEQREEVERLLELFRARGPA